MIVDGPLLSPRVLVPVPQVFYIGFIVYSPGHRISLMSPCQIFQGLVLLSMLVERLVLDFLGTQDEPAPEYTGH